MTAYVQNHGSTGEHSLTSNPGTESPATADQGIETRREHNFSVYTKSANVLNWLRDSQDTNC